MPRKALSESFLRSVKVETDSEFYDIGHPLILRVSPGGVKSWSTRVRIGGQHVRLSLGRYPHIGLSDARDLARDAHRDAESGIDPRSSKTGGEVNSRARLLVRQYIETDSEARRDHLRSEIASLPSDRRSLLFGEIACRYLEHHGKPNTRTWRKDESYLLHDVYVPIGQSPASSLRRREIHGVLDPILARGSAVQANRVLGLIRRIYRWSLERELVDLDPTAGIRKPTPEQPAGTKLTRDELAAVWGALERDESIASKVYQVIALTLCREREIREGRWSEIRGAEWEIPAERMKGRQGSRRAHIVCLSDWALEVLGGLEGLHHVYIFPGVRGPSSSGRSASGEVVVAADARPIASLSTAMRRIKDASGVEAFNARILRRTGATILGQLGWSDEVIGAVLSHVPMSVTGRHYNLYRYQEEKRAALASLAGEYLGILGRSSGGKVLPIR